MDDPNLIREALKRFQNKDFSDAFFDPIGTDEIPNALLEAMETEKEAVNASEQLRNEDEKQYEKYREVLGEENVPETFDKFREMKYNGSGEYEDLKLDYEKKRNSLQERLDYIWINGEKNFIPTGAVMTHTKTIAGAGSKKGLRVEKYLIEKFGGSQGEWEKRVGKIESEKYIFDVHWYECEYKQYNAKVKNRSEKK